MSQLARRRVEIRKKINRQEKQMYFAQRRQELLSAERQEEEGEKGWLFSIAKMSLQHNGLLGEIREKGLIQKLENINLDESIFSDLACLLPLCGNMLLDQLQLVERERILSVLVKVYRCKPMHWQLQNPSKQNFEFWYTMSYNVCILVHGLRWLGEDTAMEVEGLCWGELVRVLEVLTDRSGPWASIEQELQRKVMNQVCQTLKLLLIPEEGSYQFLQSCMTRHGFYFTFLRRCMVGLGNSPNHNKIFHEIYTTLLTTVLYLSEEVDCTHFPLFFQDSQLIELLLIEIAESRSQKWHRMSLKILGNLLHDHSGEQGTLADLLTTIVNRLSSSFLNQLFYSLTNLTSEAASKGPILEHFFREPSLCAIFKPLMDEYYQSIIDGCIRTLQCHRVDYATQSALILLIGLDRVFQVEGWRRYLSLVKGQVVIEGLMDQGEKHSRYHHLQHSAEQQTVEKIKEMLYLLYNDLKNQQSC